MLLSAAGAGFLGPKQSGAVASNSAVWADDSKHPPLYFLNCGSKAVAIGTRYCGGPAFREVEGCVARTSWEKSARVQIFGVLTYLVEELNSLHMRPDYLRRTGLWHAHTSSDVRLVHMTGILGTALRLVALYILLLPTNAGERSDGGDLAGPVVSPVPSGRQLTDVTSKEGTLMFLHVWKCGGTTLRELMCDWAKRERLPCATVASCRGLSLRENKICLVNHKLIFPDVQGDFIAKQRVIAGHFRWGFQVYAAEPHRLVTTLRNPLELYVSGEQYLNRGITATLPAATQHVANQMRKSLARPTKPPGYLHRLVGREVLTTAEMRQATIEGAQNLGEFWLVGVVEQYQGFVSVLRTLLDPANAHADLWNPHLEYKLNASPVQSSNVLASLDPELVQQFNKTLSYQWLVYGRAVSLFTSRCQEVLPWHQHGELCDVPSPPVTYY